MKKLYTTVLALACAGAAMAQNNVSTGTQKYVLLEEGTGTWCGYCTDGAARLEAILAANPRAIGVSVHENDAMEIPDGLALMTAYQPNYPNGAVDRVPHSLGDVFMNRGYWSSMTTTQLALTPTFDVNLTHSYDSTTKALSITVKAKALSAQTGSFNVNAYIIEDSVSGTGSGYNQSNYDNGTVGHQYYQAGNPIVGFQHMQVVRAMLGGPWGSTAVIPNNPAANITYTKTYTYTLPNTANYKRYKVVAFVQKQNVSVNSRQIMNAIEAKVTHGVPTGITEINDNITDLAMYPNPASSNLYITGTLDEQTDVNITVVNTVGQTVIEKNYADLNNEFNADLSLENLTSGIYFVTVSTKNTKRTERIMVNK